MAWARPHYSKSAVDRAGRDLMGEDIFSQIGAQEIINNWRSSHAFPLNTFQAGLRRKGRRIDPDCIVAQRIKRMSSVVHKLERYPKLRLSQMQDIGGCRIVLSDIDAVRQLVEDYKKGSLKHTLVRIDDYLAEPQKSGYRGVHMIYRYYSDKTKFYNNMLIEVQLRSQYQHAWATAVETVGTFLSQSLKSSIGEEKWLRFFALMGTVIAFQEGAPPVAGTSNDPLAVQLELSKLAFDLDVVSRLNIYGQAIRHVQETEEGQFFLLYLDPTANTITIKSYRKGSLMLAQRDYIMLEEETRDTGGDAVLVSVDSLSALHKAYPNYFLDTRVFTGLVEDAVSGKNLDIGEGFSTQGE